MVFSGFGHKPNEVGKYDIDTLANLACFAAETISQFNPTKLVTGMGLGWQQALALAALELDVPFIAALPFQGQEKVWPDKTQVLYRMLLEKASSVEVISSGVFSPMKYIECDKWIVNNSEGVFIFWKNW